MTVPLFLPKRRTFGHAAVLHWQYSHVPPAGIIQIPAGLLVRVGVKTSLVILRGGGLGA